MSEDPHQERQRVADEIRAARERVAASEGAKLQGELSAVARMYRLFLKNEEELRSHFAKYDDLQAFLELWDANHRERFDAFLDETDRLLHNYLAAAASLADHTMRLWKKYPPQDDEVTAEYERRVEETFKNSPLANFVQGLRNLTVHRQLPVIEGKMSFTGPAHEQGESLSSVTGLSKEALLAYEDWKKGAREYLEQADDIIDIRAVVTAYTADVAQFNEWFGKAWVGEHLVAFDEMNRLAREHDELLRRAFGQ
jgi:hypothetical protein